MGTFVVGRACLFVRIAAAALFGALMNPSRVSAREDGWSRRYGLTPPPSWIESETMGFKTFIGPEDDGLQPNIIIGHEIYNGPPDDYAETNIFTVELLCCANTLGREAFQTDGGLAGEKVTYRYKMNGLDIVQLQYYLPIAADNVYAVVGCGVPADWGDRCDAAFENAVRSFYVAHFPNSG